MKSRAIFIVVIVLLVVNVAPVWAHASLLRSLPEANATLARSPILVELLFSETLDPGFSSIVVLNAEGVQVDSGEPRVDVNDPTRLTVALRSLPDGVYTVSWKAFSTVDGHLTTGAFPFAVGNVDPAALAAADQASKRVKFSFGEMFARWGLFFSATTLMGGFLFLLLVWQPVVRTLTLSDSLRVRWRELMSLALIGFVAANILGLVVQAGQASGVEIALPWSQAVNNVLFNTRYGSLWLARFILALVLARLVVTLRPASKTRTRDMLALLGVTLANLLTISLGSHAAADAQPMLPVVFDWLHLSAASVWIGGLVCFVMGLWSVRLLESPVRTRMTAQLIPRFSVLALMSVATLTFTGLYAALIRVGTLEGLLNTLYGQTLLIKLMLLMPMIIFGAINLLWISPRLRHSADHPALLARFFRIISSELTLGAILLLSVGALTSLPPAQNASSIPSLNAQTRVDDLELALDITPGRVGQNTFTLNVTAGGIPVNNAQDVGLQFTTLSGKVPPSKVQLVRQGNGQYALKGAYLSLPDSWQVQAVVRRENKFDAYANFNFDVGATSPAQAYPWYRLNAFLILGSAIAYLAAFMWLARTGVQQFFLGLAPAIALGWVSVTVFYSPPINQQALLVNPIAPNAESVSAGKTLYERNCVACHGNNGKGDGPVGLTLNPRPADLTLHTTPGVHPDGQLYEWITNGFAGAPMPAFRQNISDEQRWHLVNYIRTLSNKP